VRVLYTTTVPKLWTDTIETHRREVRDAIIDTTASLIAERGLRGVTMSQIAEQTGIGRATLYKYFADVESILVAWHERHVSDHLRYLTELRDQADHALERLEAVLEGYAFISYQVSREQHGADLVALVHQGQHVARAQHQLNRFLRDLLVDASNAGHIRDDVPADELLSYCLYALAAAATMPSKTAVRRLVTVTLAGLQAPTGRR
jgi:AcrR family transcriptional regulator